MEKEIKYILFDAANTLIQKPLLWFRLEEVFVKNGYSIDIRELKFKHKILSEIVPFPDVTSEFFYNEFNSQLCRLLGIIPDTKLLDEIFENCKYLPWEPFDDVHLLKDISIPMGVLSNFNSGLEKLLSEKLPNIEFSDFIVSELEGVSKPNIEFYARALNKIKFDPKEVLYIGDSIKLDIEPALTLGFQVKLIDRDRFFNHSSYQLKSFTNIFKL